MNGFSLTLNFNLISKFQKWNELNIDFGGYSFIPPNNNEEFWNKDAAMSVKIGDYDLNGYIDLLMVLKDKKLVKLPEKENKSTEINRFTF